MDSSFSTDDSENLVLLENSVEDSAELENIHKNNIDISHSFDLEHGSKERDLGKHRVHEQYETDSEEEINNTAGSVLDGDFVDDSYESGGNMSKNSVSQSRRSEIFVRKKGHKPISDSDSDEEISESDEGVSEVATKKKSIGDSDPVEKISGVKTKRSTVIDSDSTETDVETQQNQNGNISEFSSDSSTSLHSINQDKCIRNTRISNLFIFGKADIYNSTAVTSEQAEGTTASAMPVNSFSGNTRCLDDPVQNTTARIESLNLDQTPRVIPLPFDKISSIESSEDDIVEVSSSEDESPKTPILKEFNRTVARQTTLDHLIVKGQSSSSGTPLQMSTKVPVSSREFLVQQQKVKRLETDLLKVRNMFRTVNLEALPDKGKLLKDKQMRLQNTLRMETEKLKNMDVSKPDTPVGGQMKTIAWEDIQAGAVAVMPKTFGKKGLTTYNVQKALTLDRLQQLHGSLETCPKEDQFTDDPKGLKVELMPHQKRALTWLMWRERQKPSGGILADDMGLGKTLTMIALMLKTMETEKRLDESDDEENQRERSDFKHSGGTLVVCPASLLNQWSGELERRTKRGLVSYDVYHGPKRETKAKRLAEYEMVITTYSIVNNEGDKSGAIFRVKWRRIVLDEAHQIRNHKSQTCEKICRLHGKSRWALTGTPVHNKELDMYSLLKFLRCTPFDDLQVWKRWVGDKSTGGQERLHTVISSLLLRRTKAELVEKGSLKFMPDRTSELIDVKLQQNEMDVYQKVLLFSRALFAQFLHQRAEKNQDIVDKDMGLVSKNGPNQEYYKMRTKLLKMNKLKEVNQHHILVLLLRLRQICCHPFLIKGMLNDNIEDMVEDDNELAEENLLDQLNNLKLDDDDTHNPHESFEGIGIEPAVGLKEASKGFLNPSNPIFSSDRPSSKIVTMLQVLQEKVLSKNDKGIIVSQWPSYLNLIAFHLKNDGIKFDQLDGSVPVHKRMTMVDDFNNPNHPMKVLLLSLTAGGVGLNLVGANHLFLLDLHWNPQLENQAQDRIYRVGQEKPVFVYKFLAADTIEQRIKSLQDQKLAIANSMLTGTKQVIESKLSLQDLKMLFEMQ